MGSADLRHKRSITPIRFITAVTQSNLYISQVKRKCGIEVGKNLRVATRRMDCLQGNSTTAATDLELVPSPNLPKNEDSRQPQCPEDKESAIVEALKHFKMNS